MSLKSDADRWGSLARFFHWTTVLLILTQGAIGLIMVELPKRPNVIPVFDFHKSLGLTILAFAVLRLAWRAFDRRPERPPTMSRTQETLARLGHAVLYTLIFAVPLSGWLFDSASALRPLYWFDLFRVPSLTGGTGYHDLAEFAEDAHFWLFWCLIAVAAGHAAIALYHHFVARDPVLLRMLPGGRAAATPLPDKET